MIYLCHQSTIITLVIKECLVSSFTLNRGGPDARRTLTTEPRTILHQKGTAQASGQEVGARRWHQASRSRDEAEQEEETNDIEIESTALQTRVNANGEGICTKIS